MALFTTFITTPVVTAFYKPTRAAPPPYNHRKLQHQSPSDYDENNTQLRLLACLHGLSDVPSTVNLIETILGSPNRPPLKLYVMHLVELSERPSSIVMALRTRRNGVPHRRLCRQAEDRIAVSFQAYGQLGRITVRAMTAVSALSTMHDDICAVAEKKRVAMVVLPFHKRLVVSEDGEVLEVESVGHGWRGVNQRLLKSAPCSVGILFDRGLGSEKDDGQCRRGGGGCRQRRVCVLFFGGPDDREALELSGRMSEHPGVAVAVVRFVKEKGMEYDTVTLRPSPEKCREKSYSFSTAALDRRLEEVWLIFFIFLFGSFNYSVKLFNIIIVE